MCIYIVTERLFKKTICNPSGFYLSGPPMLPANLYLLPNLFYLGRQLVHVLQEECQRPDLFFRECVAERRHACQTDAVFDLPE